MSDKASIGRIKFFDPMKGYGYISTEEMQENLQQKSSEGESIYFSVEDVTVTGGVVRSAQPNLREGQWVQFVIEPTKAGPKAKQITVVNSQQSSYK